MPLDPSVLSTLGGQVAGAVTRAAVSLALGGRRLSAAAADMRPTEPVDAAPAPALPAGSAPPDGAMDLTINDLIRKPLGPAAESLRLAFRDVPLSGKFSGRKHLVTQLHNVSVSRTFLNLPPAMLKNAASQMREALGMLQFIFRESQTVYVFAEKVENPHYANDNILKNMWALQTKVKGEFVPWGQVCSLPDKPLSEQIDFMRIKFDLTEIETQGVANMTVPEIEEIVAVIVAFAEFGEVKARQALLMKAGIPQVANVVDLQGAPSTVAYALFFHLSKQPKPPDDRALLGKLLDALVKMPNLPPARAEGLTALIARCQL